MKSVEFGTRYIVYEDGGIFDKEKNKYLNVTKVRDKDNYIRVNIYIDMDDGQTVRKIMQAHRIVYEAFNGKIPDGMGVVHINKINDDNRLENLRIETLLNIKKNIGHKNSPNCKKCVRIDSNQNEKVFSSIEEAAREIGTNKCIAKNISSCLHQRIKSAYNYKWRWA